MIVTERLTLVPATVVTVRAALDSPDALAAALGAVVPAGWPPQFVDAPALEFILARLDAGLEQTGWWMYFVLLPRDGARPTLVGSAGYKGPPSADGTVELGYGIVSEYQRRGFASEATRGMVARAFRFPSVRRVIAETLPELAPSIGVLQKCGFRLIGEGSEPGVIRFEITRAEHAAATGGAI